MVTRNTQSTLCDSMLTIIRFAKTYDETQTHHFECKSLDLHQQLIDATLSGFGVPSSTSTQLHGALSTISDSIKVASERTDKHQMQYWIMIT